MFKPCCPSVPDAVNVSAVKVPSGAVVLFAVTEEFVFTKAAFVKS
jgi:hypothetical protein